MDQKAIEVQEITGLDKDGWACYVETCEAYGVDEFWSSNGVGKGKEISWQDAMLLAQVKYRHNPTFVVLKQLFGYEKMSLDRYFFDMMVWQFEHASYGMSWNSSKEVDRRRIDGFQRAFLDQPFQHVSHVLGKMVFPCLYLY